jgi:hypothetical protein
MLNKIINKIFYSDKWNIGYVAQTPQSFIENKELDKKIIWLNESSADYAADPFVLIKKKRVYIFYENLQFLFEKGTINLIRDFDFSTQKIVKGITPENIHISYPYIFEDNDKTYCIPETADANEIALYDVVFDNTIQFKKRKVLLSGGPYVDSSIIYFEDKYWLFTSLKNKPGNLFIYYANKLDEEFIAHNLNPIVTDRKSYRGAGALFYINNILYRPTQNLEVKYGGSVIINQISELTADKFRSINLFEIFPTEPYNEGFHNISVSNNLIVFDGKRRYFSLSVPIKKIIRRLRYYSKDLTKKIAPGKSAA